MSKKDFIALADAIRYHNQSAGASQPGMIHHPFTYDQLEHLAAFCQSQNPNFMKFRWLDYIAGKCGKNGGKIAA